MPKNRTTSPNVLANRYSNSYSLKKVCNSVLESGSILVILTTEQCLLSFSTRILTGTKRPSANGSVRISNYKTKWRVMLDLNQLILTSNQRICYSTTK